VRLIEFFDQGVALDPDRACLVDDQGVLSFREVQNASHRIARGLLGRGISSQSKVAVFSPNCSRAFECVLGTLRLGAIWVPVNISNAIEETIFILDSLDVEVLFLSPVYLGLLSRLRDECPKIKTYISLSSGDASDVISLDHWLCGPVESVPPAVRAADTLAVILGSGGTSGRSKGVMHSDLTWEALIANMRIAMPPNKPPVHLLVAPMTHGAGVVALCLLPQGATQVIMPKFDARRVLESIERHRITHIFLPPTAIYMLLEDPDIGKFDYSTLEYFIYAGAPMSVEKLKKAMEIFGPVMAQTFGQAEAPMICTYFSPEDHMIALSSRPERLLSCGRSSYLTPTEILDSKGGISPVGETGEIAVRGNLVMQGYYNNATATAEVTGVDGWHLTGDIGRKDADGFVYIVDRKRDMIITGGFNVYPSEIEQVIWSHPAVQDCAVLGVPDEKWGEAVKAIVELKTGADASGAEILQLCKARLGAIKCPKTVDFLERLPRTANGKVSKRELRQAYWVGHERAI
jgi:acyl-CoA synthetase (AMP-forming)/AMP-acid ligase II